MRPHSIPRQASARATLLGLEAVYTVVPLSAATLTAVFVSRHHMLMDIFISFMQKGGITC